MIIGVFFKFIPKSPDKKFRFGFISDEDYELLLFNKEMKAIGAYFSENDIS